jgi:hypothetical protein
MRRPDAAFYARQKQSSGIIAISRVSKSGVRPPHPNRGIESVADDACTLDELLEFLFGIAEPGLFRSNAFRIVGLPANASDSAIRKQAEKLQFKARHGGDAGQAVGPLPLDPAPLEEMVPEAIQRLRDPERRFVEEFFWFWPQPGLGNNDPAIAALHRRDVEAAVEIWSGEVGRDDDCGRAAHNLAVMFHTLALDVEYARQTETVSEKLQRVQYSYWQRGLSHWQGVINDEAFWNSLDMRVAEFNDPRLTDQTTRQMRAALPTILLLINAQIAANASGRGAVAEAQRYRGLMEQAGFACEVVQDACARAARQIRGQLSLLSNAAFQDAAAQPETADEGVRRMLEQSCPLLAAIDVLLDPASPLGNEARDEVADVATNCLLLYSEAAGNWRTALELLDLTRPYAVGLAVRERIDYLRAEFLRFAYRSG